MRTRRELAWSKSLLSDVTCSLIMPQVTRKIPSWMRMAIPTPMRAYGMLTVCGAGACTLVVSFFVSWRLRGARRVWAIK